ncbi:unnamed protein product [Bursaphelenchus okinawaensis]|uniref:PAP-associated domain-containing protein n=1 Tax=Bursaphelenchus okinawaensis TaxID=465554 RepID=A0A811JUL2_9BILA|nr:unnamed protein product [Bursaphelenchus okinawaensis]CAG9083809.1 unnamed protein product [Bursaphelenchus okinawaensis]
MEMERVNCISQSSDDTEFRSCYSSPKNEGSLQELRLLEDSVMQNVHRLNLHEEDADDELGHDLFSNSTQLSNSDSYNSDELDHFENFYSNPKWTEKMTRHYRHSPNSSNESDGKRKKRKNQKNSDRVGPTAPRLDSNGYVDEHDYTIDQPISDLEQPHFHTMARLDHLSAQIYDFHRRHEQSMNSLNEKLHLRDLLYYAISPHFTGCGLYIVGSTLNGFGANSSDMDLCLMITPRDLDQRVDAILVLTSVMGHLKDLPWIKEMDLIFAKVPILRATFNPPFDKIVVDLNANNSVAIRNTHLLCYYSAFDWRVRPLVCAVKGWAKKRGINDANQSSLTSYSLVMMVIHYLQCGVSPAVLPSLQQLYPDRFGNKIDVRSLNVTVPLEHVDWQQGRNMMSLAELLIGFMHYYARCFNFDTMAISVRLGRSVDRAYVAKNKSPFNTLSQWRCICIEEPFTYSNTAHSVFDERVFCCIKDSFEEAYNALIAERDLNVLIHTDPIKLAEGVPVGFRHFRVPVIRYDRDNHEATEKKIVQTVASFHMEKTK